MAVSGHAVALKKSADDTETVQCEKRAVQGFGGVGSVPAALGWDFFSATDIIGC